MLRYLLLLPFLWTTLLLRAHEGMWLPTLLASIQDDMQAEGLELTAEDIYAVNTSSIKDAIVLFGGGCTAEVISGQGLISTNHHCGYSAIQRHSSLENDYLKHGFWADAHGSELRNPNLTATFVIRMEDVTERVLAALKGVTNEAERRDAVARISEQIAAEATTGTHHAGTVRAFNYGNQYHLIITETFRDVRLVGAPPSAIGKYGGDTDNWMWPRHTGDFALFRIYAGPDNKPAEPSDSNVPFAPRHVLPISLDGVEETDFAMIFGFPGTTQRYLTSYEVQHVMEVQDPMRIAMRTASLAVIDRAMRASDLTRIQYAAKQSSISNAWKKWIGQLRGLRELDALEEKRTYERAYVAQAKAAGRPEFTEVLPRLEELIARQAPYTTARDLFIEMVFYGPEVLRFGERFAQLVERYADMEQAGAVDGELEKLRGGLDAFFKDYDVEVDRAVFKALLPLYRLHIDPALAPEVLREIDTRFKGDADAWVDDLYARSVLVDRSKLDRALDRFNAKSARRLAADPGYATSRSFYESFLQEVRPTLAALGDEVMPSMRTYVRGMMELFPDRTYWPDANSSLRLSYGRVEGSEPRDAVVYDAFSTLDGVIEKHIPGDAEFDLPQKLIDLHTAKDYGPYGVSGTMPVCFTSSLHTTGGNSGSPVLNGRGELIGINFDRTWESTMSDIRFDPAKCRNISVDVRYMLFIIDRYAGAGHLIEEMQLVQGKRAPRIMDLPIHR
jgi:hypothetical protein